MIKKVWILSGLLCLALLGACGGGETQETESQAQELSTEAIGEALGNMNFSDVSLTEQKIERYMALISKLKAQGAAIDGELNSLQGLREYRKMEGVIKSEGFTDLADFVSTHAKIAWTLVALDKGNEVEELDFGNIRENAAKELEKALEDPSLTDEQKKQMENLRQMTEQSLNTQEQTIGGMLEMMKKNVTEKDKAVVGKYKTQLKQLYEMN